MFFANFLDTKNLKKVLWYQYFVPALSLYKWIGNIMKLVTECFPSQDESYSGEEVQYRIADTLQTIAERLAQKYGPQPASTEPGYREVPITTDQGDQWSSKLPSQLC